MFVQGLAFLISVILPLHFVMAAYLIAQSARSALELSKAEATAHGFDVQLIKCDGEKAVAAYAQELKRAGIDVSCEPGEKCPHVEREIQELKEFPRGMINGGLPYRLCKGSW